jgi:hypothetical protein
MTLDIHYASLLIKIYLGLPGFVWVAFIYSKISLCHDSIFICTPVHSSAQGMIAGTDNKPFRASQHFLSPRGTGESACTQ